MTAKEKYNKAFVSAFGLGSDAVDEGLKYNSIPEWDSIGHMSLISELEGAFGISMETDDIVAFESYQKGISLLEKYGVKI